MSFEFDHQPKFCFAQIADVHMVGFREEDGHIFPRLPEHAWWALGRRYDLMAQLLPRAVAQVQHDYTLEFICFTGDQVDDGFGPHGRSDLEQFRTLVSASADVPLHFLYGNHDGPQDEFAVYGQGLNYIFEVQDVCFAVLNSGSMDRQAEQESSEQALDTLRQAIQQADGRRLIVLLHQWIHPVDRDGYSIARAEAFKAALEQYPAVLAVINGHYHPGLVDSASGIAYITARAFCEPPFAYYVYEVGAESLICREFTLNPAQRCFSPGRQYLVAPGHGILCEKNLHNPE